MSGTELLDLSNELVMAVNQYLGQADLLNFRQCSSRLYNVTSTFVSSIYVGCKTYAKNGILWQSFPDDLMTSFSKTSYIPNHIICGRWVSFKLSKKNQSAWELFKHVQKLTCTENVSNTHCAEHLARVLTQFPNLSEICMPTHWGTLRAYDRKAVIALIDGLKNDGNFPRNVANFEIEINFDDKRMHESIALHRAYVKSLSIHVTENFIFQDKFCLRSLYFRVPKMFPEEDLIYFLVQQWDLKRLTLKWVRECDHFTNVTFNVIGALRSLEHLDVTEFRGINGLSFMENLQKLKSLSLRASNQDTNHRHHFNAQVIPTRIYPNVKELKLIGLQMDWKAWQEIASAFPNTQKLTLFELYYGVKVLQILTANSKLKYLKAACMADRLSTIEFQKVFIRWSVFNVHKSLLTVMKHFVDADDSVAYNMFKLLAFKGIQDGNQDLRSVLKQCKTLRTLKLPGAKFLIHEVPGLFDDIPTLLRMECGNYNMKRGDVEPTAQEEEHFYFNERRFL